MDTDQLLADLKKIRQRAVAAIGEATDLDQLESVRVGFLGKKGQLTIRLRSMGDVDQADRPVVGREANQLKSQIESALAVRADELERLDLRRQLETETVDVTLPGRHVRVGHPHPLMETWLEIERIASGLGFQVAEGPEIETDYYNYEALNIPADHPARDMQDTFYVTGDILLRTHTSPVQIRYMQAHAPDLPVRIIAPGRVYRRDDDPTHSPMFHQVEALLVDRGVTMADLKGVLELFAQELFGAGTRIRLRPSYFPFTEPSAEVDISCTMCGGDGCRTCEGSGWLEILGSGMVHPRVLENGGYDPGQVSGFAFGMGIDRVAQLRYGIADIRHLFSGDVRFIRQF